MKPWKRFEYRIVHHLREHGFRADRVPASGAAKGFKGDVVAENGYLKLRIDAKSTASKEKIRLDRRDVDKAAEGAMQGEVPAVVFSFKRHKVLYVVLAGDHSDRSGGVRELHRNSGKTILLKKEQIYPGTATQSCLVFVLADESVYTVARLDDMLGWLAEQHQGGRVRQGAQ